MKIHNENGIIYWMLNIDTIISIGTNLQKQILVFIGIWKYTSNANAVYSSKKLSEDTTSVKCFVF